MANSEPELREEIRDITQTTLDKGELDTAISRAQRHISVQFDQTTDLDWFTDDVAEEALFWTSCLFCKVATGEIDAQTIRTGSIHVEDLPSETERRVTTWLRNKRTAIQQLRGSETGGAIGITAPEREDRVYGDDGVDETGGGDVL